MIEGVGDGNWLHVPHEDDIAIISSILQLEDIKLVVPEYVTHFNVPLIIAEIVIPVLIGVPLNIKSSFVYNNSPVWQSTNTLTLTQLNISSNITNVACPWTSTVLVKVIDGVNVTVGVGGLYWQIENETPVDPQELTVGVGVGVTPIDVTSKSTSSQSTLGDGVGNGSQSQSK